MGRRRRNAQMAAALRLLAKDSDKPLLRQAAAMDGVALRTLAEKDEIDCSQAHLYNIAAGRVLPSLQLARALADYYGVEVEVLFPVKAIRGAT